MLRVTSPKQAFDYPNFVSDDLWIIWWGNDFRWPDGRREVRFLSSTQRDAMRDYALTTIDWQDAMTFATRAAAEAMLQLHTERRGRSYHDIQITTVGEMKRRKGYA